MLADFIPGSRWLCNCRNTWLHSHRNRWSQRQHHVIDFVLVIFHRVTSIAGFSWTRPPAPRPISYSQTLDLRTLQTSLLRSIPELSQIFIFANQTVSPILSPMNPLLSGASLRVGAIPLLIRNSQCDPMRHVRSGLETASNHRRRGTESRMRRHVSNHSSRPRGSGPGIRRVITTQ